MHMKSDNLSSESSAAAGVGAQQREELADLAEMVLNLAREINLHTAANEDLIHLTATEINVLRYVDRHPGTIPKQAAHRVRLQRSNFSVALHSLKEKGMISVVADECDGRSVRLFPTEAATNNLAHHRIQWAELLAAALRDNMDIHGCLQVLAQLGSVFDAMPRS